MRRINSLSRTSAFLTLTVLVGAGLASAAMPAAAPKPGATFLGKLSGPRSEGFPGAKVEGQITFRVSRDGKRVDKIKVDLVPIYKCSGGDVMSSEVPVAPKLVPIKNGRFSIAKGGWRLTGAFTSATRAKGTLNLTEDLNVSVGEEETCNTGTLKWSVQAR